MELYLYTITDDPRKLVKTLPTNPAEIDSRTGTIRGSVDVIRPEILVTGDVVTANYCKIPAFGRYYYIEERNVVREGLTLLTLRVDVLMSWAAEIKNCPAVFERSQTLVNAYVRDNMVKQQNFMRAYTMDFPFEFTYGGQYEEEYVVILAG